MYRKFDADGNTNKRPLGKLKAVRATLQRIPALAAGRLLFVTKVALAS